MFSPTTAKKILELIASTEEEIKPLSVEEQEAKLNAFIAICQEFTNLKVGDNVVTTEDGASRYRFPMKDQIAKIVSFFPAGTLDEDSRAVHGEIAVVCPNHGGVTVYSVDLRYYKKA